MKILITGGNGYIAKSLYSALHTKYDITVITRQDFDLTCWTSTHKFFHDKSFDVVIHTATSGGSRLKEETDIVIRENLLMYRNLLNHQDKFTKFISFGSGAELGNPTSPYGISKQAISHHMAMMPNFLNLRIFAVFDENELDTRFIKSNIVRYINYESMVIHGDKLMDFFYMKDLVSLIEFYILNNNLDKEIDCCHNDTIALSGIASIINNLSYWKVPINYNNLKPTNSYIGKSTELPIKVLGLEQGIKNVFEELK
jgi:nucleoside-diphosphate-sugar epimerase